MHAVIEGMQVWGYIGAAVPVALATALAAWKRYI
jgi:hypothetical protein